MYKRFLQKLGLGFVLWAMACFTVAAQQDSLRSYKLEQVTVYGAHDFPQQQSLSPVQLLKGAALQRLNSLSVADALRYFSGLQLKDYGGVGGLKTINVRSMGSNHTAVFYDGVQLGNAQNGQIDLGKYSLENLESLALYIGQKTQLLQPAKAYAAGSTLYLQARKPQLTDTIPQKLQLGLKTGSFGLLNPSVLYERRLGPNLQASFQSELMQSNGHYRFRYTNGHYDTTMVRKNSDVLALRNELGLYGQLAQSGGQWQLKLYQYASERGVPGAIVANKYDFDQRQWDQNFFIQARYENDSTKRYRIMLHVKYAYDDTHYIDPKMVSDKGILDNRYIQQEQYLSVAQQHQLFKHLNIAWSSDYSRQTLDANLAYFSYPLRHSFLNVLALEADLGRLKLQGNLLHSYIDESVKLNQSAGNYQNIKPALFFQWNPLKNKLFKLHGFYKSGFRMPTFNDLYYTFVGNTKLRPEFIHQYDLGISKVFLKPTRFLEHLSIDADVYYHAVSDKIVAMPTLNLFRWTMVNLDRVSIWGLETQWKWAWSFPGLLKLQHQLKYTYERATDKSPNGYTYGHQIPYIPKHSASFTAQFDYHSWALNYSFIYTAERYSQKANIAVNYVEPWYTHDLSLQKSWGEAAKSWKLGVEINNLLNQYYDVVLNYPMPGTNVRISIKKQF